MAGTSMAMVSGTVIDPTMKPATAIDMGADLEESAPAWLSALLHTTDSAYPIGGFAHSGGLEGMVSLDQVRTPEDLQHFLHHDIAATLGSVELPLLYQAWLAATAEDDGVLVLLDQVSEAVRFSAEQRQASRRLGTQRWSLLGKLHASRMGDGECALFDQFGLSLPHKHLCVVAGVEAALLGMPVSAAMTALSHQTVMMVAQAAMKIMRIGQTTVQSLVAEMAAQYPGLIANAKTLDLDDVGTCLPRLDIACAWHETANARMFLS